MILPVGVSLEITGVSATIEKLAAVPRPTVATIAAFAAVPAIAPIAMTNAVPTIAMILLEFLMLNSPLQAARGGVSVYA